MQTWVSLRALLDSLDSETEFGNLDPISQRTLEWIAIRNQSDVPLYVQEIVMKAQLASPATVHKVLANLEKMDFIAVSIDAEDTRRRVVKVTAHTHKLFAQLSKAVESWKRLHPEGAAMTRSKTRPIPG